jgi:hypothetical protein
VIETESAFETFDPFVLFKKTMSAIAICVPFS